MNRCGVRTLSQLVERVCASASRSTRAVASSRRSGRSRPLGKKISSTFRPVPVSNFGETVYGGGTVRDRTWGDYVAPPRTLQAVVCALFTLFPCPPTHY